jgi:hypothetical protein
MAFLVHLDRTHRDHNMDILALPKTSLVIGKSPESMLSPMVGKPTSNISTTLELPGSSCQELRHVSIELGLGIG